METKREGPYLRFSAVCHGCRYELSERYHRQGDSGADVYCTHPSFEGCSCSARRSIGDTRWITPDWCPFAAPMLSIRKQLESLK